MKLFIKKGILFCSIPILLFFILFAVFRSADAHLLRNYIIDNKITAVVAGDSHSMVAINDSLLKGCKNFSLMSENFVFTYSKLKVMLNETSSIKKVFLGVGLHSISSYCDRRYEGKGSIYFFSRDFPLLALQEKLSMIRKYRSVFTSALPAIVRQGFSDLYISQKNYSSRRQISNLPWKSMADSAGIQKRIQLQFVDAEKIKKFSDMQIYYLEKIISLCAKQNVLLFFLKTPVHPFYLESIPDVYKEKYDFFTKSNHINVIDFKELNLCNDCYLYDGDHVNGAGSTQVTAYFEKYLK